MEGAYPYESLPYPYNLPPEEVGYAEFYGEPGPGPASAAAMAAREAPPIPAFNAFAASDSYGVGDSKRYADHEWVDEWASGESGEEASSDEGDDEEDDNEDYEEEEEQPVRRRPIIKLRARRAQEESDLSSLSSEGEAELEEPAPRKSTKKRPDKRSEDSIKVEAVDPPPGKAGKGPAKNIKVAGKGFKSPAIAMKQPGKKTKSKTKVEEAMEVDESTPSDVEMEVRSQSTPKKKKGDKKAAADVKMEVDDKADKPKKEKKKKGAAAQHSTSPLASTTVPSVTAATARPPPPTLEAATAPPTLAAAAAAAAPAQGVRPPPSAAAIAHARPPGQPVRPGMPGQTMPVRPGAPGGPPVRPGLALPPGAVARPPGQPGMPVRPGQPMMRPPHPGMQPGVARPHGQVPGQVPGQPGQMVRPGMPHPGARPPMARPPPPRPQPPAAPAEPPRPYYISELRVNPTRPGHILCSVPIPPSGAGPRNPPSQILGLDGKQFIGPAPLKPTATFATIIHRALTNLPRGRGTLGEVCNWVAGEWEWFRLNPEAGWQNSIRHNLSLNKAFLKVPRIPEDDPESKGSVWILDPEEGPLFEEKQRRDALKNEGKAKNAEEKRMRERMKAEERTRKQREREIQMAEARGMMRPGMPMGVQSAVRPVRPPVVSANRGVLAPKAKIVVQISPITPVLRAKSVIDKTDASGAPLPFVCDGTTLVLDQQTFGHLTTDIIDKLQLLGAGGAVDVLSAWVVNKNKQAAQKAAAAKAVGPKPGPVRPPAPVARPPAPSGTPARPPAPSAKPAVSGKPLPGPAPPGANLTKVISMIAEVANARGDVNTVGPNASALLRYIRVVGVDIDLRVAERIWATGVVPPLPPKKTNGAKPAVRPPAPTAGAVRPPNGAAVRPPANGTPGSQAVRPPNAAPAVRPPAPGTAPAATTAPGGAPRPPAPPATSSLPQAPGASTTARPPAAPTPAAQNAVPPAAAGVKRKLEEGTNGMPTPMPTPAADDPQAKRAKLEGAA